MTAARRRVLVIASSIVGAIAVYAWFFGWTTVLTIEAHWMGKQNPILYKVPISLPDSSTSSAPTRTFSTDQFEIDVPWTEMVEVKAKKMPQPWLVLNSRDEIGLAVMPGSPNEQVKLLKVSGHEAETNALFGSGALESDYSLAQHMLETTPNDIHPMSSKREDLSRMMMLALKSTILPSSANSGIFYIHTPEFRGFQFGDPAVAPKGIVGDLYSADGKMELVFSNKNHLITQPEINRVLQSLHKKAN